MVPLQNVRIHVRPKLRVSRAGYGCPGIEKGAERWTDQKRMSQAGFL